MKQTLQQKIEDLRISVATLVSEHKRVSSENRLLKKALQIASYSIAEKNLVKDDLNEKVLELYNNFINLAKVEDKNESTKKE